MKLRSRLLTFILSASMALSMTAPVLADEGVPDSTTAATQEAEVNKEPAEQDNNRETAGQDNNVSSVPAAVQNPVVQIPDTAEQVQSGTPVSPGESIKETSSDSEAQSAGRETQGNQGNTDVQTAGKNTQESSDTDPEDKNTQEPNHNASNTANDESDAGKTQKANADAEAGVEKKDNKGDSSETPVSSGALQENTEETENWEVVNNAKMFRVVSAVTSGTGNNRVLTVTLSGTGYNYLFKGRKAEAEAASEASWTKGIEKSGQYSFAIPIDVNESVIPVSARSARKGAWYGRQFTLDWNSKTLTVDDEQEAAENVSVNFCVQNVDGVSLTDVELTVVGSDGKRVDASPDGSYTLTVGDSYTVKAGAEGCKEREIIYQAKKGETKAVISLDAVSDYSNNVHTDVLSGTDAADGEYTNIKTQKSGGLHDTTEMTISKVTVSGGKAFAEITWKSKNKVTHFLLGYLDNKGEDSSLYNPETGNVGDAYKDFCFTATSRQEGDYYYSSAMIPIQLGSAFDLSVRYPDAMSKPYWSKYSVTIQADPGEKATQKVRFQATDTNGKEVKGAEVTVTGSDGKIVKADADGGYTLYRDASYHIAAAADGYNSVSLDYTVTGDASVDLKLVRKEAGAFDLTVINKLNMFKVVSASVTGSGTNRTLTIVLSGKGYHYLFKGDTGSASVSKAGDRIPYQVNSNGLYEFRIPVSDSDSTFDLAALSAKEQKWYSRRLNLDWSRKTLTVSRGSGETVADQKPVDFSDNASNTGTYSVKNNASEERAGKGPVSGSAAVNGYTFLWSGGSGRAIITCMRVFEQNGQLYATIHFSRENGEASAYTQVRSLGQTVSGDNTFTIPVNKNANTTIQALTAAMSAPHWITYTIYVGEGGSAENSLAANTRKLDEKAPEITGLTVKGEMKITYSDKIKIFTYANDIYLIEVNMVKDTARKKDDGSSESNTAVKRTGTESASSETEASETEASETEISGDEKEKIYMDTRENTSDLDVYSNDIVKYLVVPEGKEIPAGLDKDVVIIQQPADKTYVTSKEALQILTDLNKTEKIKAVGLEEKDIQDNDVKAAMNKNDGEDGKIYQAGTYDKWDLKTLIKQKVNLTVESSDILPHEEKTGEITGQTDEKTADKNRKLSEKTADENRKSSEKTADESMESFEKLASQAVQMNMAMFVDRSADEKNDLAKAEWYKVYGIIFDAQDQAEELYKKAVDKASEQEKKEAVEALKAEKSTEK